jgi:hypothetical protein
MTKLAALLIIIFTAQAPTPEVIAKPVPFDRTTIQEHYQAPLWQKGPGHRGVDLAIDPQSAIVAPFAGEVFFSGKVVNRQVITLLSDTGLKATFEPVCAIHAKGSRVAMGQKIAVLCEPETDYEMHCESCVHFSIRNEYGYLNPLLFFGMLKPAVLTG